MSGEARLAVALAGASLAAAATAAAAAAAPGVAAAHGAAAAHGRVGVMIVGRTRTLLAARSVPIAAATVPVGRRRCSVAAGTPLAVLATAGRSGGPVFSLRDYGHCSRSPRDAESLFVTAIGGDRNAGRDGWVYKVGERAGSTDAAGLSGAFGDGRRLRAGQRVLWFWCVMGANSCQRTLGLTAPASPVAPGARFTVTVSGYDDQGRGVAAAGATVMLGGSSASADSAGRASLPAPVSPGAYAVSAQQAGAVPSFPETVLVR
jgi:hypothetical protein